MATYQHGVYNQEQATSLTTPIQSSAALQVIFGTAPVHLADDPTKAANTPKLCYSFAECQAAVGYSDDFKNFTLCQSIDANFRVFNNAPIVLVNVLDPDNSKHTKSNSEESCTVTNGQAVYKKPYVLLHTMVVKKDSSPLEADVDYTAAHDDDGNVVITMISETGKETGLELVRQIYPKLGLTPGLLLAPGWSHDPVVAAALQAKTTKVNGNFDCNTYLDIAADSTGATVYTAVKTAKEKLGAGSSHAAVFWPKGAVGEKIYCLSAMAAAETAATDAANGDVPHESPSNKDLKITATVLDDGTEVALDQEQANLLNGQGVITAINANGFKLWGNNTAAYPSTTDPKDRWLAVRRFFDWDGNNFILTYFQKVDKPGNKRLIQSIVDSQNIIGNGYVARDYCAGYRLEFKEDENPITDLLDGKLTTHTYLAPYIPAEKIVNIREYDTAALEAALTGGGE